MTENKIIIDEKLVRLKQKLEILHASFGFLFQIKREVEMRDRIVDQILKELELVLDPIIKVESK